MLYFSILLVAAVFFLAERKKTSKFSSYLESFIFFVFGFITIAYGAGNYFTGQGINQAVISTLLLGLGNAGFGEYMALIATSALSVFILLYLTRQYFLLAIKEPKRHYKLTAPICVLLFLTAFIIHPLSHDAVALHRHFSAEQSGDLYRYYREPNLKPSQANGKNIVFIFMESLEQAYFDETRFPGLTPHLKKIIADKGIAFTNVHQISGSEYTIAGMVSSSCGLPLMAPYHGNSMSGVEDFYPNAQCLGDVLKANGYKLSFMQGSSLKFSGIDAFYRTHQFDFIAGRDQLTERLDDKSYLNGWGLYDDSLLEFAKQHFTEQAEKEGQFAFFVATLDSHHPNGHLSKSCESDLFQDGSNPILNAIHCTDKLVADFITSIVQSEHADNTIIVLVSDHLAMKTTASDLMPPGKDRRNLFAIINSNGSQVNVDYDKKASPFDIAPTVLSTLGINTDLGLGRNLFVSESLLKDADEFNGKLHSWRKSILGFWGFSSLTKKISINFETKKLVIGDQRINLPVLLKIDQHNRIQPFFEEGVPEKLYEQLLFLSAGDKFLWVDRCKSQNIVLDTNLNDEFCLTQGVFSKNYRVFPLKPIQDFNLYNYDTLKEVFPSTEKLTKRIEEKKYKNSYYEAHLDTQVFFNNEGLPGYLKSIDGLSGREKWGRWSDANLSADVILEFQDDLPTNFVLELEVGAFDPNVGKQVQISVGDSIKNIEIISANARIYRIAFSGVSSTRKIVITPAQPTSRASVSNSKDSRALGLSFISMRLLSSVIDGHDLIKKSKDSTRFIAHAGGTIDGLSYTNSLEAMNYSYSLGFRLFELDIIETADGYFVAAHDWDGWKKQTGYIGTLPPTLNDFKQFKIHNRYTPMTIDDINRWFAAHDDAVLVTDKINKPHAFSGEFIDPSRLIMELFSWDAVEQANSNSIQAMPTWDIVERIQGDVVKFLKNNNIKFIASSRNILEDQYALLNEIKKEGIKVYAFHVNHKKGYDENYMLCHELEYFYGMYADNWDFDKDFDPSSCLNSLHLLPELGYATSLESGILFNRKGLPKFLFEAKGLSYHESWGRWSDANKNPSVEFTFNEPLPTEFTLEIEAGAFGPNIGQLATVTIGSITKTFKLESNNPKKYSLTFKNIENSEIISITPPQPTSPHELGLSSDKRLLGLGFVSLKILRSQVSSN